MQPLQNSLESELTCYAKRELNKIKAYILNLDQDKTALLMDVIRYFDTNFILEKFSEKQLTADRWLHNYFIFHGYLPSLSFLLPLTKDSSTIGLSKSNDSSRLFAMTLLHQVGRTKIFLRHLNLTKTGMLDVSCSNNVIEFNKTNSGIGIELLDTIEDKNIDRTLMGHFGKQELKTRRMPENVIKKMHELVFTWRSDFIGYGAAPEIDDYFLDEITRLAKEWDIYSGVHPEFRLGPIKGKDFALVTLILMSFYMKHLAFSFSYIEKFPTSQIDNILTIWTEKRT